MEIKLGRQRLDIFSPEADMIAQVFQDSSNTSTNHRKNVKLMNRNFDHQEFIDCLVVILQSKKEVKCDYTIQFLSIFFQQLDGEDRLHSVVIDLLLQALQAANKDVRSRASQILACYMNSVDEISDENITSIQNILCERIYDKDSFVRVNSCSSLCRLQNSGSEDDDQKVCEELLKVLQNDPLAYYRN